MCWQSGSNIDVGNMFTFFFEHHLSAIERGGRERERGMRFFLFLARGMMIPVFTLLFRCGCHYYYVTFTFLVERGVNMQRWNHGDEGREQIIARHGFWVKSPDTPAWGVVSRAANTTYVLKIQLLFGLAVQ